MNKSSSSAKTPNVIFFLLFGFVGFFMICLGGYYYLDSNQLVNNGVLAEGKVVEVESRWDGDFTYYYPVIEFRTEAGVRVAFKSANGETSYSRHTVGQTVPVLYLPDDPSKAMINTYGGVWSRPMIVILIGFIFFSLGFGMIYTQISKRNLEVFLASNGRRVIAKVYSVNEIASDQGKKCVINARFEEGGKGYLMNSDVLNMDADDLKDLKEIEVIIDPKNPHKYIVNTEKILILKHDCQ